MALDEQDLKLVTEVLPNVASQLREILSGTFAATSRIATPSAREADPRLDEMASILSKNSHQMLRLMGNLTEAGELFNDEPYRLENGDVIGLCRTLCEKAEVPFELKGVKLTFVSEQEYHIIKLEKDKLERLLLNLLSNALKFTLAGGEVTLRVRVSDRLVKISVSDTGCGIAPDRLERVFDGFADTQRMNAAPHGLGLGLPICRQIARRHGGTIVAESTPGKGATFTLSLKNEKGPLLVMRDRQFEYAGGFNNVLVELSDALTTQAFRQKYLD